MSHVLLRRGSPRKNSNSQNTGTRAQGKRRFLARLALPAFHAFPRLSADSVLSRSQNQLGAPSEHAHVRVSSRIRVSAACRFPRPDPSTKGVQCFHAARAGVVQTVLSNAVHAGAPSQQRSPTFTHLFGGGRRSAVRAEGVQPLQAAPFSSCRIRGTVSAATLVRASAPRPGRARGEAAPQRAKTPLARGLARPATRADT